MAMAASAMYPNTFVRGTGRSTTTVSPATPESAQTPVQAVQQEYLQQEQQIAEEQYNTLFCRALYDYEAQDASALSFRRGDIIEILTQQPSGWWDGLLGEERGWFPSNYVAIISDEEAELALSQQEFGTADTRPTDQQPTTSAIAPHALSSGAQSENEEWLENELSYRSRSKEGQKDITQNGGQSSDFWMPEVTADGQIYYVNTQTGQRSRYLPQETEDEVSDGDLAGLASQSTSRSGTSAGLAFGLNEASEASSESDADVQPTDPWVKKLADDGMSYYYLNTRDGKVQWTTPEATGATKVKSSRANAALPSDVSRQPDTSRLSVYSDDSDIQPFDHLLQSRPRQNNGSSQALVGSSIRTEPNPAALMELTSAERIAKSLQHALEPPSPSLVTDLSSVARSAIQAVVENVQTSGVNRQGEDDQRMDQLIYSAVLAVRNLLYISAAPSSQMPINIGQGGARDAKVHSTSTSPLKPAQRKVTATLSRLVLSARAMQYDSGSQMADTLNRIETDSEELERAVLSFVLEVQRSEHNQARPEKHHKRLQGVFSTANIGLGLVGGGAAGSWKGFGYVSLDDRDGMPQKPLSTEAVAEVGTSLSQLQEGIGALGQALRLTADNSVQQVRSRVQELVTQISNFLSLIADIHVARHVDIDGIRQAGDAAANDHYSHSVENARHLVRTLEAVTQAIYDDSSALLVTTQTLHDGDGDPLRGEREAAYDLLDSLASSLGMNLNLVKQTFEGLLSVGHEQADIAQGDYNGSIEWRMSRLSVINDHINGTQQISKEAYGSDNEDVVDMGFALKPGLRTQKSAAESSYDSYRTLAAVDTTPVLTRDSEDNTLVNHSPVESRGVLPENDGTFDDEAPATKPASRPSGPGKLERLLGKEYADRVAADLQPWYLRPNYSPSDIIIESDGVRGGTVPALVERLTAHEQADTTFTRAFLMTYKSFTTLDELFDLLVARFRIQPPDGLTPPELEEWGKLKQHVIQMRVINTFKSMITDDGVLEKEDMYILERMKEFIASEEVSRLAAAKQLLILIERARGQGDIKTLVNMNLGSPPPPIIPKSGKKLKLLDIDPLELARQLTIMESQLYQRIKPMECLQRAREQKTDNVDNITTVIQTSNRIADWVAESILSKEDSRRRAQIVKHLIGVADRCRTLNNFSTMIAITSGLNTPPIRRLKRTWEQVNQRFMAQFGACEMTIDSNKNFTRYRQLMANVTPPCVPFIGVFLSTLQFIQDGNPDNLPGGLVNFRKRQKASEVINDIKRWQALPFNFQSLPAVQNYITESLNQFSTSDTKASSDHFWALSLEREPREREDEKMARLLQESGFL